MRLLKFLAAALFALAPAAAFGAQATYTMPVAGPLTMSTFVGSDLNPALAAILSNNSGASAPAATGQPLAYQWWMNTAASPRVLGLYDTTNWVGIGNLDSSAHTWTPTGAALKLSGSSSGTATVTPQAAAGTPTLTLPNASGTFAVNATTPLVLSATTGALTCPSCATTTSGGAISGTPPVAVSSGGAVSITGAAGQVLAGAGPAFTATPTLGVAGSTVGTLAFANATSGAVTLSPPTGALGAVTLSLPAATDTLVAKATTDTLTNKTYDTAGTGNVFKINGTGISAVTGTGAAVLANTPTLITPVLGAATGTSLNLSGLTASSALATDGSKNLVSVANTGTGNNVLATSPTLVTPALGAATATSLNGNTFTAGTYTLTGTAGKTLNFANSLTLSGTDATTQTFPATSATIARTDAGQTFTGVDVFSSPTLGTPTINGAATGTGVASAATASTLALRDGSGNIFGNVLSPNLTSTATAAGTTTLTNASSQVQVFTGTLVQIVAMPAVSTLSLGFPFRIINQSSGVVTVNSSGGNLILAIGPGNVGNFNVVSTSGTGAASWAYDYISSGAGTGTVTSVTCGTGLTGGTITTSGTCALSSPVSIANGGTNSTGGAVVKVKTVVFTAGGTYTPSTGILYAVVEGYAGGGGGGGTGTSGAGGGAGGGAAGSYARVTLSAATIGASQTVAIGAAGTGATAGNNAGGTGGDTSLGSLLVAKGGLGGSGVAGSAGASLGAGGAGVVSTTGDVLGTGGHGGYGFSTGAALGVSGNGANSPLGGGGIGSVSAGAGNVTGGAATGYAAGGGGGVMSNTVATAGGAGAPGILIITEYLNQ